MSKDKTYRRLITSVRWVETARRLKAEALYTCSSCGKVTPRLCVHHKIPLETARDEREAELLCFKESNLQVLCYKCHSEIHLREKYNSKPRVKERARQRVERFFETFFNKENDEGESQVGE